MRQHRAGPGPSQRLAPWVPALAALGRDDNIGVFYFHLGNCAATVAPMEICGSEG